MNRLIAIVPAPRGFGYAVLEGPDALVDWGLKGTSRLRGRPHAWCIRQAERLLEEFVPDVLVLEDHHYDPRFRRGAGAKRFLAEIAKRATKRAVRVRYIRRRQVGRVADHASDSTRYHVALTVVHRFPELAWRLPPVRKPWMSEDARMAIFGAVALALACYAPTASQPPRSPGTSDGRMVSALNACDTTPSTRSRK